jgi:hypothetical protein
MYVPDRAAHRLVAPEKLRRGGVARPLKSCLQRVGSARASTVQGRLRPLHCTQNKYTRLRTLLTLATT